MSGLGQFVSLFNNQIFAKKALNKLKKYPNFWFSMAKTVHFDMLYKTI